MSARDSSVVRDWWESALEVERTRRMLSRAGVLPESEEAYYRSKPWKWHAERGIALTLEGVMLACGVDPEQGWETECGDLLKLMQARDAARGGVK